MHGRKLKTVFIMMAFNNIQGTKKENFAKINVLIREKEKGDLACNIAAQGGIIIYSHGINGNLCFLQYVFYLCCAAWCGFLKLFCMLVTDYTSRNQQKVKKFILMF